MKSKYTFHMQNFLECIPQSLYTPCKMRNMIDLSNNLVGTSGEIVFIRNKFLLKCYFKPFMPLKPNANVNENISFLRVSTECRRKIKNR